MPRLCLLHRCVFDATRRQGQTNAALLGLSLLGINVRPQIRLPNFHSSAAARDLDRVAVLGAYLIFHCNTTRKTLLAEVRSVLDLVCVASHLLSSSLGFWEGQEDVVTLPALLAVCTTSPKAARAVQSYLNSSYFVARTIGNHCDARQSSVPPCAWKTDDIQHPRHVSSRGHVM